MLSKLTLAHSPHLLISVGGKTSLTSTLPFLSQIAEEDLTSASTSVTSFHLPNNASRRNHPISTFASNRTLSDQDLFTRVNNDSNNNDVGHNLLSTTDKPISYSHFNFESSLKQQLAKGNSLASLSSESLDLPLNTGDVIGGPGATRPKVHTTSPVNDSIVESSGLISNNNMKNKAKFRKQTKNIAARAAQRRANLHHKELMEEIGMIYLREKMIVILLS